MSRVLLACELSSTDPGSDALVESFLAALPSSDAVVASDDPDRVARQYGCETVAADDPVAIAGIIRKVDAVVFAGGTIVADSRRQAGNGSSSNGVSAPQIALATRYLGKSLAMVGVGVGSLLRAGARVRARSLVRRSDLLVLRDEPSAQALAEAGAPAPFWVGADPTWTLLAAPPSVAGRSEEVIVSLDADHASHAWIDSLAVAMRPIVGSGLQVRVQPWSGCELVAEAAVEVARRLGASGLVLPAPSSMSEARDIFGDARVVIGLNAHALVASGAAGTSFVAASDETGPRGLADRLGQQLADVLIDPSRLAGAVLSAATSPPPSCASVRAEIAAAEEGFRLLRLLMHGGITPESSDVSGLLLEPATW